MKGNKLKILFVLTLICTLVISAPISISATTLKVGKVKKIYATTYFDGMSKKSEKGKVLLHTYCKNAKKYEYYKASAAKGKYKKIKTVSSEQIGVLVKANDGLSFYKARGINGKKKGNFCSPVASYRANMSLVDSTIDNASNSITLKLLIDNSKSNTSMVFSNNKKDKIEMSEGFSQKRLKQFLEDKGLKKVVDEYDEEEITYVYVHEDGREVDISDIYSQEQKFNTKLVDENGAEINEAVVDPNTQGNIYLKCVYQRPQKDKHVFDNNLQLQLAQDLLNDIIKNGKTKDSFALTKVFTVNSNGKDYKFIATMYGGDDYSISGIASK